MAKIFKYTLKSNFLSYPFLVAAGAAILAGVIEAFLCIVNGEGQKFENMSLMSNDTPIILLYIAAVLPSLLTGREFSEGAVRNKIVTGTTRTGFFMSHLIVNGLIALAMTVLYYIPMFIACAKYFDHFQPYMVLLSMACIFLSLLFVTTLGTVIAVMLQKTILSLVAMVFVMFVLSFAANWITSNLNQPEFIEGTREYGHVDQFGAYDNKITEYKEPNPFYVKSKAARKAMWTAYCVMPFGCNMQGAGIINGKLTSVQQMHRIWQEAEPEYGRYGSIKELQDNFFLMPLYLFGSTAVISAAGLLLFRRRNLK